MKIVIYGAGNNGKLVLELLDKYGLKSNVVGFADSIKKGEYLGLPIRSIDTLEKDTVFIIAIVNYNVVAAICEKLKKDNFSHIYWFKHPRKVLMIGSFFEEQCTDCFFWEGCVLEQVEMHIMDACNLNCRGCAHFSPIFDKTIPDFQKRIRDVRCLKEKFDHIIRFYILGGEPFLNPEIGEYAKEIRRILPNTELYIVTNGLLIPQADAQVLEMIRNAKVRVSISEYKPTHEIINDISNRLEEFQILYEIRAYDSKQKFNLPLSLKEHEEPYCISNGCITIWNGKIARCPSLMYIHYFNDYFHTQYPEEGILDLNDAPVKAELLQFLKQEVKLCKYCGKSEIEWSVCGKKATLCDFVADA